VYLNFSFVVKIEKNKYKKINIKKCYNKHGECIYKNKKEESGLSVIFIKKLYGISIFSFKKRKRNRSVYLPIRIKQI
jgi:hypothetical protein